jgi:hypothetical protein
MRMPWYPPLPSKVCKVFERETLGMDRGGMSERRHETIPRVSGSVLSSEVWQICHRGLVGKAGVR